MGRPRKPRSTDGQIPIGFDPDTIDLRLEQIIPLKVISELIRKSAKFQQIAASIREVGIIEPLVVSADPQDKDRYILLDGHLRLEVIRDFGENEVTCLISKDDEAFTYNKHISRLSTVMEHKMIARAVGRGISEEKIAKALNLDVGSIARKKNLLENICPEAVDILKDKIVSNEIFIILRRMKPFRQIEAAGLMRAANIYTVPYGRALLAATPQNHLTDPEKPKKIRGLDEEQMAKMEREMANLQREFQMIEENYRTDFMNLTSAKGYLTALLGNAKIVRYLAHNHAEFLKQFQKISEMTSLGASP